eukprot:11501607-Alexandrium_andersonii.AAC.1
MDHPGSERMGQGLLAGRASAPLEGPQLIRDTLAGGLAVELPGEVACDGTVLRVAVGDPNQRVAEVG